MGRSRLDGRFSAKRNDFKKSHPYHDHTYAGVRAHSLSSGNQQFVKRKSTEQPPLDRQASCQAIHGELWHMVEVVAVLTHSPVRSPDESITQFPTPDCLLKCRLMKVCQSVEPYLKKLLDCITEDKIYSDTLEKFALKQGMTPKEIKGSFSDEQFKIISQSMDCDSFDLTLKFKCIEIFKKFNQKVNGNDKFDNTLKKLRDIRNNLCHDREDYTELQCDSLANDLKVLVAELIDIIHIWDEHMDILSEKKKAKAAINKIMNEGISEEHFRYMCLLEVLKSVVEPALHKVTQLLCSKKKKGNFKDYFTGNHMSNSKYKGYFFKEERIILESNTDDIRMDVTLHTKVIEVCKDWHHLLKDDFPAKEELINIIKKIRGIRNNIYHNILSMSPVDCITEANGLGNSLNDLTNFIQRKINMEDEDAHVIDIDQIYCNIGWIMSVPNNS